MIWKEKKKLFFCICMIFLLYILDEILSGVEEEDVVFFVVGDLFGLVNK